MGSLGVPELLFILVLALLVFGPRRLPEIGRTIGRALGEFRRATSDLKRSIDVELRADEIRDTPKPKPAPEARQSVLGSAVESRPGPAGAEPAGTVAAGSEDPAVGADSADAPDAESGGPPAGPDAAAEPVGSSDAPGKAAAPERGPAPHGEGSPGRGD